MGLTSFPYAVEDELSNIFIYKGVGRLKQEVGFLFVGKIIKAWEIFVDFKEKFDSFGTVM